MGDLFPCKQLPLTKEGKDRFDQIFGHGEYDKDKHSDTWNEALESCVEREVKGK